MGLNTAGIKITLYYYTCSGGDGSAYPRFFTTKEKRDAYMDAEENSKYFEGFCDADGEVTVIVNPDGTVTDPTRGPYSRIDREPRED
jgi:hypothetical protein